MKVNLIAFGIAKEIMSESEIDFELGKKANILDLKQSLIDRYPAFEKLKSLKFAVNEDYQNDDFVLQENDEVVIIPPVSGG